MGDRIKCTCEKDNIKEAAKVFLDWAISKDAMNEYSKNFAVTTIDTEIRCQKDFQRIH